MNDAVAPKLAPPPDCVDARRRSSCTGTLGGRRSNSRGWRRHERARDVLRVRHVQLRRCAATCAKATALPAATRRPQRSSGTGWTAVARPVGLLRLGGGDCRRRSRPAPPTAVTAERDEDRHRAPRMLLGSSDAWARRSRVNAIDLPPVSDADGPVVSRPAGTRIAPTGRSCVSVNIGADGCRRQSAFSRLRQEAAETKEARAQARASRKHSPVAAS